MSCDRFLSVALGVVLAIVIDKITEYFTDTHHEPVKSIARATERRPSHCNFKRHGGGQRERGVGDDGDRRHDSDLVVYLGWPSTNLVEQGAYVLYGVAMTGIGMLSLTGNNVAMDSFGPISDNANGVAEMAGVTEGNARQTLADLDAVGNTTKAITKGVAIGSAVIAAVSLFGSFITDVGLVQLRLGLPKLEAFDIAEPVGLRRLFDGRHHSVAV